MTIGERIKDLRKLQGMTLEQFGSRVGVTKQTVSRIENGINNLTDQMAISICREFGVSETWLRTGEGEMTPPVTKESEIAKITATLFQSKASDLELGLIKAYFELDPNLRQMLLEHFKSSLNLMSGNIRKEV